MRSLSLPERGFVEVELADGGMATLGVYEARVLWHWRPLRVPVYEADGAPLGMSLLRGSTLTIEVIPRGAVTIDEGSRVSKHKRAWEHGFEHQRSKKLKCDLLKWFSSPFSRARPR